MSVTLVQENRSQAPSMGGKSRFAKKAAPSAIRLTLDFKNELAASIPALRAYARSLCRDRTTADDLVQETLLKAWSARERFDFTMSMKSWTFAILHNVFISVWRRAKEKPSDVRPYAQSESMESELKMREATRLLKTLPMLQQEALTLVVAAGFSYAEASKITGVAVGTVKSRVSRARTALQAALGRG